jgi:hypothetical protein
MSPEPEDYKDWLEHPVTEWVMAQMLGWAKLQKQRWADIAWDAEEVDPMLLREAQVRADCYESIPASPLEDWLSIEEQLSDAEA